MERSSRTTARLRTMEIEPSSLFQATPTLPRSSFFASMVEDSHVETRLVEYRRPPHGNEEASELVGVGVAHGLTPFGR